MKKGWTFMKKDDLMYEKVFGREHFWHYHPELIKQGDCYMVKVIVKEGEGHTFHKHPKMNEILYVLNGTAEQWVENEMQLLNAGESIFIPSDVGHATFNGGKGELEFLAILSPPEGWEEGTVDISKELPYSNYR
ncbi:cupin domain-containing protein [Aurantibacter crassamenti]|uniref:cupin domain-containing protein n=1 Tax=Aurantibacter crassamenti TaxID=1837375 RepID=UPI001939D18D|nr:cupin domain-containing protein [Aurantibacter crassamenti]MBM1105718.1 cupin domain-containing protein [Aurantibacter crassamenti]